MDLAALKNFDVKEFFDKLKSGGFSNKKTLIKFGIGFGAILVFLIIFTLNPSFKRFNIF